MNQNNTPLLQVHDLHVTFPTPAGDLHAVNGISYSVQHGQIMGIVGESGSGKSAAAYAVMRLVQNPGKIAGGRIFYEDLDILAMSQKELTSFRGRSIGMIFQDAMKCLDPVFTIGFQLMETIRAHEKISKAEARRRSIEVLTAVGMNDPESLLRRYPHELSGGQRQRVMIAMVLILEPGLIIADEPTTALDVTIQDQIVQLLKKLCREKGMSMVFITHNFGLVADLCDQVTVMYGGKVMERGSAEDIFYASAHPYTRSLIRAIPSADLLCRERLIPIEGTPIDPVHPPKGCPFAPRCPMAKDICHEQCPAERQISAGHTSACWRSPEEVASFG